VSTIILEWFTQQDNNIVKICVVNEAEDILVEVIISTRLVNFWLQVHALHAMQADISARDTEKRAGGAGNSRSLGISEQAGSTGTLR
jgi:hypothetical protein